MTLQEEVDGLEKAGFPESARILKIFLSNPKLRMYVSIGKFVDKVCDEIDLISEGNSGILNSDDKQFERISTLVKSFGDYADVFSQGEKIVGVVGAETGDTGQISMIDSLAKAKENGDNQSRKK